MLQLSLDILFSILIIYCIFSLFLPFVVNKDYRSKIPEPISEGGPSALSNELLQKLQVIQKSTSMCARLPTNQV